MLPDIFPYRILPENLNKLQFTKDLEALLEQLSPDLICLDMTPIPWLVFAKLPETPVVYITNFFLTRNCSFETGQTHMFRKSKDNINRIRLARGLKPIQNVKDLYEKDAVLLCDPAALLESIEPLSESHHIIGPCSWEPEIDLPGELKQQNDLLFISFGSTGYKSIPRQHVERIAKTLEVQTVVWVGRSQQQSFESESVIQHLVYQKLPASQVISRSRFVITHGGVGSTYQALINGSPVGFWPSHPNQSILASIIQDSGCGVLLEPDVSYVEDMKQLLPQLQFHSGKMAQSLSNVDGPKNAANIISQMLT